jgi:hypothetical protein
MSIDNCCEVILSRNPEYRSNPYENEDQRGTTILSIENKLHLNVNRKVLFLDSEQYNEYFQEFGIRCPDSIKNFNKREEGSNSEEIKISDNINIHHKEKLSLQVDDLYGCPIYKNSKGASVVRINYVRIMTFKNEKLSLSARILPFFSGLWTKFFT